MINVPAIITLQGKEIVPVRAIPFVAGNLTPLSVAKLLADPELQLIAHVLNSNGASSAMRPNDWNRVVTDLHSLAATGNLTSTHEQLERLPASTFVFWEDLWRTYENCYLPHRRALTPDNYLPAELANFELHRNANMPKEIVDFVFDGFKPSSHAFGPQQQTLAASQASAKKTKAVATNWKMKVQIEAAAHFKVLRKSGASPTVHSILDKMVAWCRTNDVKTDSGIYPSSGYLRTHVLGGKHWSPPP